MLYYLQLILYKVKLLWYNVQQQPLLFMEMSMAQHWSSGHILQLKKLAVYIISGVLVTAQCCSNRSGWPENLDKGSSDIEPLPIDGGGSPITGVG